MACYVSRLRRIPTTSPCFRDGAAHLTADTPGELHAAAAALGLRHDWCLPGAGSASLRYRVSADRRAAAVQMGAMERC